MVSSKFGLQTRLLYYKGLLKKLFCYFWSFRFLKFKITCLEDKTLKTMFSQSSYKVIALHDFVRFRIPALQNSPVNFFKNWTKPLFFWLISSNFINSRNCFKSLCIIWANFNRAV